MKRHFASFSSGQIRYSRYSDGAHPVRFESGVWEILSPVPRSFKTAQGLLAELTGHPKGRHWSIDRYFGLGVYDQSQRIGETNVFELFPVKKLRVPLLKPKSLGIDLDRRAGEVRKLLYAGFGRQMYVSGYDPEDVLQEVYKGLLARNRGKCPWDPAKSSFGHYVHMVCGCILANYHRKNNRIRQFERSGVSCPENGLYVYRDAASSVTHPAPVTAEHSACLMAETVEDLAEYMRTQFRGHDVAIDVLPYVTAGTSRSDIAEALQVSPATVSRAISTIRKNATAWHSKNA